MQEQAPEPFADPSSDTTEPDALEPFSDLDIKLATGDEPAVWYLNL